MNDEANPHFYSMLDQMIEGHQWVKNNLGEGEEWLRYMRNVQYTVQYAITLWQQHFSLKIDITKLYTWDQNGLESENKTEGRGK